MHYVVWGRLGLLRGIKGAILVFSILHFFCELIFNIATFSVLVLDFFFYLLLHWGGWRYLLLILLSSWIVLFLSYFRQTRSDPMWRHFVKRFSILILILIIICFNSPAFKCKKSKCLLEIELRNQSRFSYYTQISKQASQLFQANRVAALHDFGNSCARIEIWPLL